MENPYWTEDGKAKNLALLTSTERCKMLETLRQTEAREWMSRYKAKASKIGQAKAQNWWQSVKLDIEKRRGKDGVDTLTTEMNRQRHEKPISNH